MSLRHRLLGIAAALLLSAPLTMVTAAPGQAQTKPAVKDLGGAAPASVIFIGNSFFYYNNSMHGHVGRFVAEGMKGHTYRNTSVTISGSGLDWHNVEA